MKIQIVSDNFDRNQFEELVQRVAWRLVRSAADRFGEDKGDKKRDWSVSQLRREFPKTFLDEAGAEKAENYIRAAYANYKTERGLAQ